MADAEPEKRADAPLQFVLGRFRVIVPVNDLSTVPVTLPAQPICCDAQVPTIVDDF
jgi:hypothetical protein